MIQCYRAKSNHNQINSTELKPKNKKQYQFQKITEKKEEIKRNNIKS
jgi:hypothetical protein